jgi:hypothetical protein
VRRPFLEDIPQLADRDAAPTGDRGRFQGDEPLKQDAAFVFEGEHDGAAPGRNSVAHHLQRHRRLPEPLWSADERKFTAAQTSPKVAVEWFQTGGPDRGSDPRTVLHPTIGRCQQFGQARDPPVSRA